MALDPREYLNDTEEVMRLAQDGHQSKIWTAMPAIVKSVDLTKMTLVCQIAVQVRYEKPDGSIGWNDWSNSPIQDVPICFPKTAGFAITFPIAAGDEILLIVASRCIDFWWQNGGVGNMPVDYRMHDLSDGFAIPGPCSQPNVFTSISSTDLQIRNAAGTTYLSIGADGKIGFQNATVSLKKILSDLQSALTTFSTTLAGFSGGGSPATQAMLQAPGAALEAALVPVLAEITGLLK